MSEHVPETCGESSGLWLPLTEYSVKSGMSTSTIRRKIKSNSIRYRVDNGRYLILFESETDASEQRSPLTELKNSHRTPEKKRTPATFTRAPKWDDSLAVPVMEKAVTLVSEAFEHSLKEKDERILLLERRNLDLQDRLDELRTLVQVLEEKYEVRY